MCIYDYKYIPQPSVRHGHAYMPHSDLVFNNMFLTLYVHVVRDPRQQLSLRQLGASCESCDSCTILLCKSGAGWPVSCVAAVQYSELSSAAPVMQLFIKDLVVASWNESERRSKW